MNSFSSHKLVRTLNRVRVVRKITAVSRDVIVLWRAGRGEVEGVVHGAGGHLAVVHRALHTHRKQTNKNDG